MSGQIPRYGKHFRLKNEQARVLWMANRKYELKADPAYYARSDRTSKYWYAYGPRGLLTVLPATTLTGAMNVILEHLAVLHRGLRSPNPPLVFSAQRL
jgi:hypothetical protein